MSLNAAYVYKARHEGQWYVAMYPKWSKHAGIKIIYPISYCMHWCLTGPSSYTLISSDLLLYFIQYLAIWWIHQACNEISCYSVEYVLYCPCIRFNMGFLCCSQISEQLWYLSQTEGMFAFLFSLTWTLLFWT